MESVLNKYKYTKSGLALGNAWEHLGHTLDSLIVGSSYFLVNICLILAVIPAGLLPINIICQNLTNK